MVVHPRECESTLNSLTGFQEAGGRSQEQLLSLPQGCWDPRTWALAFSAPKPQAGSWVKSGASRKQTGSHVDASAQAEAQPAWPTWPWFLGYLKGCVWVVLALGSTLCLFDFMYLDAHICLKPKIYIDFKEIDSALFTYTPGYLTVCVGNFRNVSPWRKSTVYKKWNDSWYEFPHGTNRVLWSEINSRKNTYI